MGGLNRLTRRMVPWDTLAFNQDKSRMHLPQDPLASPTRTPRGINCEAGICPQRDRATNEEIAGHSDIRMCPFLPTRPGLVQASEREGLALLPPIWPRDPIPASDMQVGMAR